MTQCIFRIFLYCLPLLFALHTIAEAKYEENLAICAIFKDEGPWMREWIEYHQLLGVQKFYLYNNNSTDEYAKVLAPYQEKGIVELIEWPSPPGEFWGPYQKSAYNDCIARVKGKTKWLAIIDLDEFIVVSDGRRIPAVLKDYENYGGVLLFWQMFGTSGLWEIPEGKTMIESLVWKAHWQYGPNRNCKSIVRPERVRDYHVHGANYNKPYNDHYLDRTRGGDKPVILEPMHVNHYYTRTKGYYFAKKNPRREQVEGHLKTREQAANLFAQLRQVKDETILRWLPALRRKLGIDDAPPNLR